MSIFKKTARIILLSIGFASAALAQENVFYILRNNSPARMTAAQTSMDSLSKHHPAIHILIPQAFQIDANGVVWGTVNTETAEFAAQHHMKLMPLITNTDFISEKVHQFLSDKDAQARALQSILSICEKEHYYGVQWDFEMVPLADKTALTAFYEEAARTLHKKGFKVSFALSPLVSEAPFASDILKRLYVNWEGAYDFKRLGTASDFVSIMAYNQHGGSTTPGPTADIQWVEQVVRYALQHISAEKISLGIPAYSTYWFTGTTTGDSTGKIAVNSMGISFEKANYLVQKYHAHLTWDENAQLNFAIFPRAWLNEYIFVEDARSFAAKNELAKKYHLRGISVFDLGTEDPSIWATLEVKQPI